MNIYEEIKKKITENIKLRNKELTSFLRYIDSIVQNKSSDNLVKISDELVISVLKTEKKKVEEELSYIAKSGKESGSRKYELEIQLGEINNLLPEEKSDEEVESIIKGIIDSNKDIVGNKMIGLIMSKIKREYPIDIDLKKASKIAQNLLKNP